jgi:predicted ATPase/DNA-binding SARP family transcriptional activator/DNA-binding CsgD family transcriptional regulator
MTYSILQDQLSDPATAPLLSITLFGGFDVRVGDRTIPSSAWATERDRHIIQMLAFAPRHCLHRDYLLDQLWPEKDSYSGNILDKVLHRIRRLLDPSGRPRQSPFLRTMSNVVYLYHGHECVIDVERFERAASEAFSAKDTNACRVAMAVYTGDLLETDPYSPEVNGKREYFRQIYRKLAIQYAAAMQMEGREDEAISTLTTLIVRQPQNEEGYAALMALHGTHHNLYEVQRLYHNLVKALSLYSVTPSEEFERLYSTIMHARQFKETPLSELLQNREHRSTGGSLSSLVAENRTYVGRVIGREHELHELQNLAQTRRFITVTGMPGVGKTCLVQEIVRESAARFPDGVRYIELAETDDPAIVPYLVLHACQGTPSADQTTIQAIFAALGERKMLLILDNCEHLSATCAALIDAILDACPNVTIIATSRKRLGSATEYPFPLAPLPFPDQEGAASFDDLLGYGAIQLFVERAAANQHDFRLTEMNAYLVVQICQMLHGLPLALELVAAHKRLLSLEEMIQSINGHIIWLRLQDATRPHRQRTLLTALDWSHALLSFNARMIFRRLAVFAGSFSLKAIEEICTNADLSREAMMEAMKELLEQSLVNAQEDSSGMRFVVLPIIREYAQEQLNQSAETAEIMRRLSMWSIQSATRIVAGMRGNDQPHWVHMMVRWYPTFRHVLHYSQEHMKTEIGLHLCALLRPFWGHQGLLLEGMYWLRVFLAKQDEEMSQLVRANALNAFAWLGQEAGLLKESDDAASVALHLAEMCKDAIAKIEAVMILAGNQNWRGKSQDAYQMLWQHIEFARQQPSSHHLLVFLSDLGDFATEHGARDTAWEHYAECLSLAQHHENARMTAIALTNLGRLSLDRNDLSVASSQLEAATRMMKQLGNIRGTAEAMLSASIVKWKQGKIKNAHSLIIDALQHYQKADMTFGVIVCLEFLAYLASVHDMHDMSVFLWSVGTHARQRHHIHASVIQHPVPDLNQLRTNMGNDAFSEAWERGTYSSVKDCIVAVLEWRPVWVPTNGHREPMKNQALTKRESQVAQLAIQGKSRPQIAGELGISEETVKTHLNNLYKKLGTNNRDEVAKLFTSMS